MSEETKAWTSAQNAQTRAFLESRPSYERGAAACGGDRQGRVGELGHGTATGWSLRGRDGPARRTWCSSTSRRSSSRPWSALADLDDVASARRSSIRTPSTRRARRRSTGFVPSPDGQLVAVSCHRAVPSMARCTCSAWRPGTRRRQHPAVQAGTAGGSLAWAADSSRFWYTRVPAPGERGGKTWRSSNRFGTTSLVSRWTGIDATRPGR